MTKKDKQNDQAKQKATLRKQAEEQVRNMEPVSGSSQTNVESQRALHELHVHEIELEMQNEELRTAQTEIEAGRARYLDLYDLAPVGYCTLSEQGLILEANLTAATLLGMTRDALIKRPIYRFIVKDDQDICYLHLQQLFHAHSTLRRGSGQAGKPQECELRMLKADGTPLWAKLTSTAAQAEDGSPLCRVALSDITEHKQAEQALRDSEEQFRTLAAMAPTGIYVTDAKGDCLYANPRWCEMAGMNMQDSLGQGWVQGLHPEDRASVFANWKRMVDSGGKWGMEYRFQTPDKRVTWVYALAIPQRDDAGKIVKYVGINLDITARKQLDVNREMGRSILDILSRTANIQSSIHEILTTIKASIGFDAAGIRLQKGDDYPYYSQEGFSDEFLKKENSLIHRSMDGGLCRDINGKVLLECTCGLVISGKTDPSNPLFTPGGSVWTNNSFPLLDLPPDQDLRAHPRNTCIHQGYASIALIPIRAKGANIGLLQINDRQPGRLTLAMVESLEHIGELIGEALLRKRTEEALQLTRFSVEAASDALFWLTPDARIVDVNAAACRSLGYTREELLQLRVPDIDPHYNAEDSQERFAKLRQLGSRTFESEHRTKDGRLFPVEIVDNYVKYGSEERSCAFVRDISERKKTEGAILQLNTELENKHRDVLLTHQLSDKYLERLKIATRTAQIGIWDWNIVDNDLTWDNMICDLYGVPHGFFKGGVEAWSEYIHPDDRSRALSDLQAAIRGEKEYAPEFRIIWPDGSIHDIKANSQTFFENGKPIRMVGTNIDISAHKQADDALRMSKDLLSETEHIGKVGGWSFNIDTMEQVWTDEVYRIHEVEITRNPSVQTGINYYTKASKPIIEKAVQRAIEHGEGFDLELEIITAKGNTRAVHTIGKADLKNRRIYGFFQDITERKRTEEELRKAERNLQSTVDGLSSHIVVLDENGDIILTNTSYRDFAERNGIKPEAVSEGTNYLAVCDTVTGENSEEAKPFAAGIRDVLSGKRQSFKMEYPCHSPDEKRWFIGRVTQFAGEGPRRVIVAHTNITERKQAEEELKRHLNILNETGRMAKVGGWELNLETGIPRWTEETFRIFEIDATSDAPLMPEGLSCYSQESQPIIAEAVQRCIEHGEPYEVEVELITKKGNLRWVRTNGKPNYVNGIIKSISGTIQDITESKQISDEATALKEALDSVAGFGFAKDLNLKYVSANRSFCDLLKIPYNKIQGMTDYDIFPADLADKYIADDRRVIETAEPITVEEVTINSKTNQRFTVQTRKFPRFDKDGRVTGLYGMGYDITEIRRAEHALRENEAKFRAAFMTGPDGFFWATLPDGRILEVNPSFESVFGYTREEAIGKTSLELGLYAEPGERARMIAMLQEKGTVKDLELKGRKKDGTLIKVSLSINQLELSGKVYSLGITRDITERKRAEEELRESKALTEAVVENIPLMVFLKEAQDLRFVVFNKAGEELLGYDRNAFLGKNNLDLFPPEQAAHFMAKDREVLDGESGLLDIPEEPIETARKGQRLLHTRKICIRGADGTTKYLLGISDDITDRKRTEKELLQRDEALRTRNQELERFNRASVGRELRMIELKSEINELCRQAGLPPRYSVEPPDGTDQGGA